MSAIRRPPWWYRRGARDCDFTTVFLPVRGTLFTWLLTGWPHTADNVTIGNIAVQSFEKSEKLEVRFMNMRKRVRSLSRGWKLTIAGAIAGVALAATMLFNSEFFAVHIVPQKRASAHRTTKALDADQVFWETLHSGRDDDIETALIATTGAYLQDPNDPVTAAHIAWLHTWRASEISRVETARPTVTDDILLSQRYFDEAVRLDPSDARYLGFLAGTMMAEGNVHQDERLTRRGYFTLRRAIHAWPEFNLFTGGFVLSRQLAESARFREALEWQWQTLDRCFGEKVDRVQVDYGKYMNLATTNGPKRVCWNSWIAPHNFEGFFLNMGDMLVKSGDPETARKIYAVSRLSSTYAAWPYREVLERRIQDAANNVHNFNEATPPSDRVNARMMIATPFTCTGCHQQR
jgi:hypothetical protein